MELTPQPQNLLNPEWELVRGADKKDLLELCEVREPSGAVRAGRLGRRSLGKVAGVVGLSAAMLVEDDPPLSKANVSSAAREIEGDGAGLEAPGLSSSSGELQMHLLLLGGDVGCFPLATAFPLAATMPCFSMAEAVPRFPALVTAPCSPGAGAASVPSNLRRYSNTSLCM